MKNRPLSREKLVGFVRARLQRKGFPRIQISVILLFTGVVGLLSSIVLLNLGLSEMALRYPLSIFIAYIAFLVLLRIWLWLNTKPNLPELDLSGADLSGVSMPSFNADSSDAADAPFKFGGGADFGGGGAGGKWGASLTPESGSSSFLDGATADLDLDEIGILIVAVIAIFALFFAAIYIIYVAPLLLAEILVDGVLVVGFYRSVREIDEIGWLKTAVKKTIVVAIAVALIFGIAGLVFSVMTPEARTIGEVFAETESNPE